MKFSDFTRNIRNWFGGRPEPPANLAEPPSPGFNAPEIREIREVEHALDSFSRLSLDGRFRAVIQAGAFKNSCRITAAAPDIDRVRLKRNGAKLTVDCDGRPLPDGTIELEIKCITAPTTVKSAGRNRIVFNNAASDRLELKLTGAGEIELPNARVGTLVLELDDLSRADCAGDLPDCEIRLNGECTAKIDGVLRSLRADVTGRSRLKAATADLAELRISGASSVKLAVRKRITGKIAGQSRLKYSGQPDVSGLKGSAGSKASAREE